MNLTLTHRTVAALIGMGAIAVTSATSAPLTEPGATWSAPVTLTPSARAAADVHTSGSTAAGAYVMTGGATGAWNVTAGMITGGEPGAGQDISGPLATRLPHPDISRRGEVTIAAWETGVGIAARGASGSTWGATTALATNGSRPSTAVDGRGRAWVAWTQGDGVYVARNDGGWQMMGRIAAGAGARTVRIVAHGDGIALAWAQPASAVARARWTVRSALVTPASTQAVDLDLAATVSAARPAIASNGSTLAIAWRREGFVGPTTHDYIDSVQVATWTGGTWSRAQVHAPVVAVRVHDPEVAVAPTGEIAVAYSRSSGRDSSQLAVLRSRSTDGTWTAETTLYHSVNGSITESSGSLQPLPRFDAGGGLVASWIQSESWAPYVIPIVAARQDDGTWRTRAITARTRNGEWPSIVPAPDGQRSLAFWRDHDGSGGFSARAAAFVPPAPASAAPAPAPTGTLPAAPSDPTVRTGTVGAITRAQAAQDADRAQATRRAPRRAALTVRAVRTGRALVTLRPLGRSGGSGHRWQVRVPRGVSAVRLDGAGAAAGRYLAEARQGGTVIGRRTVTLAAPARRGMSLGGATQTGWIMADARIVSASDRALTLDLLASGMTSVLFRRIPADASPDFAGRLGHSLWLDAPLRVTLDIQENSYIFEALRLSSGSLATVAIAGARSLDPDEIGAAQLVSIADGCRISGC